MTCTKNKPQYNGQRSQSYADTDVTAMTYVKASKSPQLSQTPRYLDISPEESTLLGENTELVANT